MDPDILNVVLYDLDLDDVLKLPRLSKAWQKCMQAHDVISDYLRCAWATQSGNTRIFGAVINGRQISIKYSKIIKSAMESPNKDILEWWYKNANRMGLDAAMFFNQVCFKIRNYRDPKDIPILDWWASKVSRHSSYRWCIVTELVDSLKRAPKLPSGYLHASNGKLYSPEVARWWSDNYYGISLYRFKYV